MENRYKSYKILVYALGALCVAGVAVFTAVERAFYDTSKFLFGRDAPVWLLWLFVALAAVAAVCGAVIVSSRDFPLKYRGKNPMLVVFSSMLCTLSLICVPLILFLRRNDLTDHLNALWNSGNVNVGTASFLVKAGTVTALLAAVYFALVFFIEKVKPAFAIVTGAWIILVLLRFYYDMTSIVQDPLRKLNTFALCAALLFLLCEMFYSVGRPFARPFAAIGAIAAFACAVTGFPVVILTVLGFYKLDSSIGYYLFEAGFALYAYGRLLAFTERSAFFEDLKQKDKRRLRFTIIRKKNRKDRQTDESAAPERLEASEPVDVAPGSVEAPAEVAGGDGNSDGGADGDGGDV